MSSDVVLLVHGHASPDFVMTPLRKFLASNGYRPIYWRYPSLTQSVSVHVANLVQSLQELDADADVRQIYICAHSLGTIITRASVLKFRPAKLRRIVLLAPPNRGVWLASLLEPALSKFIPLLAELSRDSQSFVNRLPPLPADLDVGTIAASLDHFVAAEETKLPGERDHVVLTSMHTLPLHRQVPRLVQNFFRTGRFNISS